MDGESLIPIGEFARITGIKRVNLIYYDECGLLTPAQIRPNGYRYYSLRQLGAAYLILTLKEFGLTLNEIKAISQDRSSTDLLSLFSRQRAKIRQGMELLKQKLQMMQSYEDLISRAADAAPHEIVVKRMPAESFLPGPMIQSFDPGNYIEHFTDFMQFTRQQGYSFGFPYGIEVNQESIGGKEIEACGRFYIHMPDAGEAKPAGQYAILYSKDDGCQFSARLVKLKSYIESHNLRIAGNAYIDYLIDEKVTLEYDDYLVRVSIPVKGVKARTN